MVSQDSSPDLDPSELAEMLSARDADRLLALLRDLAPDDARARLLRRVLELGLSDAERAAALLRSAAASPATLTVGSDSGYGGPGHGRGAGDEVPELGPTPDFGQRYQIHETLGEGGMGRVVRATDRLLARQVAIKLMRDPGRRHGSRLLREARAQARVNHEHVCKVFDVGVTDGQLFVAMQLIRGPTLRAAAPSLSVRERVELVGQAARAVHAAHLMGLVHRDLKPSNIIVEPGERGGWKAFVVDFGLVRDLDDDAGTATEGIAGSPHYMAPEQVRGQRDRIDWRSDVYGLGATLFELLVGEPPFADRPGGDALVAALAEEPRFPRDAARKLPADLRAIVLKCLEKEPARRYASARELADDLDRFLAGETVTARPAGPTTRAARWVRKNRRLAAVAGVATLACLVIAGLWLRTTLRVRERVAIERRLGQEVAAIESLRRFAAMLPEGSGHEDSAAVRDVMGRIEDEMAGLGAAGQGPGLYALGRGELALGNLEAARSRLESAWAAGAREPEVAIALGRTLAALYQQRLEEAARLPSRQLRDQQTAEIEAALRVPALDYLKAGKGAAVDSADYVEGLIALLEGRFDDALELAGKAARERPWLYEADRLRGDTLMARGIAAEHSGDYDRALADFEAAGGPYAAAHEVARSDHRLDQAECGRRVQILHLVARRGESPEDRLDWALEACEAAQRAAPDDPAAFESMAQLSWVVGEHLLRTGRDPRPVLLRAVSMAEEALARDPESVIGYGRMGIARWRIAYWERDHGLDPREQAALAVEAFSRAVEVDPGSAWSYSNLGMVHWLVAAWQDEHGLDPMPELERAIAAGETAVEAAPDLSTTSTNLGMCLWQLGAFQEARGLDPRPAFRRAIDTLERSIELNPSSSHTRNNLGLVYSSLADLSALEGGDPEPDLERSIVHFREGQKLQPSNYFLFFNEASSRVKLARYRIAQGRDPDDQLDAARSALAPALAQNPDDADVHVLLARIELLGGRWQLVGRKRDPGPQLERAERSLRAAIALKPDATDALLSLGEVELTRAQRSIASGSSPRDHVEAGLRWLDRADRTNPSSGSLAGMRGRLLVELARAAGSSGERRAAATRALEAFDEASQREPGSEREYRDAIAAARELAGDSRD